MNPFSLSVDSSRRRPPTPGRSKARAILRAWREAGEADAAAALANDPELGEDRSLALDLAYEEYCLRCETGAAPDLEEFCRRFPAFHSSLRRLLAAHQLLDQVPHLLPDPAAIDWPEPGDRLEDLVLLRELGRGAFARAYLAEEHSAGERVIVVKLSLEGPQEAHTLGKVKHPRVISILSAQVLDAQALTVVRMPYHGCATLHDVIDRVHPQRGKAGPRAARAILAAVQQARRPEDPPPGREEASPLVDDPAPGILERGTFVEGVMYLGLQLAEALKGTHDQGFVHQDLKPSNVLISPQGHIYLLDFNLSADQKSLVTRVGGTLPYMAPEQAETLLRPERERAPDPRSDLFSLGVLLYELLTDRLPFGGLPGHATPEEAARVLRQKQREGYTPLGELVPEADAEAVRLIGACLACEPAARPASAGALAEDLRRYLSGRSRRKRWLGRHPRTVALTLALLLALAGLGGWWWANRPPPHQRAYAQGVTLYRQGSYREAEEAFSRAARAQPDARFWLAAAQAQLGQGKHAPALASLAEADRLRPGHAPTQALHAYCLALNANAAAAVKEGEKTLRTDCANRAAVLNNIAYSRSTTGKEPDLRQALAEIEEGLALDPGLPALHYNRAMIAFRLWHSYPKQRPEMPPSVLLADIETAIGLGLKTPALLLDAARLVDQVGQGDERLVDRALAYLEEAVHLGYPASKASSYPLWSVPLKADPRFLRLRSGLPYAPPPGDPRLVCPFPHLLD